MSRARIVAVGALALSVAYGLALVAFFPEQVDSILVSYKTFFGGLL